MTGQPPSFTHHAMREAAGRASGSRVVSRERAISVGELVRVRVSADQACLIRSAEFCSSRRGGGDVSRLEGTREKGIHQAPSWSAGDAAEGAPSVIGLRVSSGCTWQPRLSPWAGAVCSTFQSVGQRSGPGCLRVSGAVAPSAASKLALSRSLLKSIYHGLWQNCVVQEVIRPQWILQPAPFCRRHRHSAP